MNPRYQQILQLTQSKKKENTRLVNRLKKWNPRELDRKFQELHEQVFEEIDCLECANCCSSISPAVQDNDIRKIAKTLRMKPSGVVEQYMLLDEENDYVMSTTPCPFLLPDKYCSVYESRPLACKGFPHTDSPKMQKLLKLTLKNTLVCPAVALMFEELKKEF